MQTYKDDAHKIEFITISGPLPFWIKLYKADGECANGETSWLLIDDVKCDQFNAKHMLDWYAERYFK